MILEIRDHPYQYETEKLLRVFFPNEKLRIVHGEAADCGEQAVVTTAATDTQVFVRFTDKSGVLEESAARGDDGELAMATLLFRVLQSRTGYTPKWGLLTGVRPSKLFLTLERERGTDGAKRYFTETLLVSPEKTELASSVGAREQAVLSLSRPESCSLYVSIPFCPTRCSYCSFVSQAVSTPSARRLVPEYVRLLAREIKETGQIAKDLGLRLESVYFGGGTPTTLSAEQLETLLSAVRKAFDLSHLREYTVEAGRPDTVTPEKLQTLRAGGVTRVSINPQTFNDEILRTIGRQHTAEMTDRAFFAARAAGFADINMDLIAGLPNESVASFCRSVDRAVALAPENITVHTLSLKRASTLTADGTQFDKESAQAADEMLHYAASALGAAGFNPYYMYRQSKTLGNLENTGYTTAGHECLYNIFMMEECHTVLAAGAGAVTKLKAPHGADISRIFNYKYPYEYIAGFAELMERKRAIPAFYEAHGI